MEEEVTTTYSKSTQLSRPTLTPNRQYLRDLTRHAQHSRGSLQQAQSLIAHPLLIKQRRASRNQTPKPTRNPHAIPTILEHQTCNRNVLHQNQRRLAIRAKRKSVAHIIAQANQVRAALQHVRQERKTFCGLRVDELEQLRDFDDGGGPDDADAETFGDAEFHTGGVGEVDVVEERGVACGTEEGDTDVCDGLGEVVCYGGEDGAQGGAEGVHGCGCGWRAELVV